MLRSRNVLSYQGKSRSGLRFPKAHMKVPKSRSGLRFPSGSGSGFGSGSGPVPVLVLVLVRLGFLFGSDFGPVLVLVWIWFWSFSAASETLIFRSRRIYPVKASFLSLSTSQRCKWKCPTLQTLVLPVSLAQLSVVWAHNLLKLYHICFIPR